MNNTMRLLALSSLVALVVTLGSSDTEPRFDITLSITATGERAVGARSAEVEVSVVNGAELLAEGERDPNWERRGDSLLAYKRLPTTLHYQGTVRADTVLLLSRHAFCGGVEVTIGERSERYDLYADAVAAPLRIRPIDWIAHPKASARSGILARALLQFLFVLGVVYAFSAWVRGRRQRPVPHDRPRLWPFVLPSLLAYGSALLAFWPGQLSPDSLTLWESIQLGRFSDAAPVLLSWAYWLPSHLWQSPGVLVSLHIIALSSVTGLVLVELCMLGVPHSVALGAALVTPLVPANALMATTLWKDVPYTIVALYILVLLLRLLQQDRPTRSWRAGFALGLFALMMTRHNGLLVAVGLPLCVVSVLPTQRRFLLSTSGALLACFLLFKTFVFPAAGVAPLGAHYQAMTAMHFVAAHRAAGTPMSKEAEAMLANALPLPDWVAGYKCQETTPLFFHANVNYGALARSAGAMNRLALTLTREAPRVSWDHFRCMTSMLWRIGARADERLYTVPFGVFRSPATDVLGIVEASKWPQLRDALKQLAAVSERPSLIWFSWRPAFWLLVLIYVSGLLAVTKRNGRYLLLALPSLLNTASLVPIIPSPDFRYQFCVFMSGILLLPLLFTAGSKQEKSG